MTLGCPGCGVGYCRPTQRGGDGTMLDHIWAELLHLAESMAYYIPGFNPADRGIQIATVAILIFVLVGWTAGRR